MSFSSRLKSNLKLFERAPLLSFRGLFAVYLLTGFFFALQNSWTSTDSLMTSLLVPNIAQGYGVDLSNVRQVQIMTDPVGCYFRYASSGDYLSIYPIGMFILALPLQLTLWASAWVIGSPVDVTTNGFFYTRFEIEKLSASVLAALTTVGLHRCLLNVVSHRFALLTTLLFMAGSSCLSMLCQGLWQHTGISLILIWMISFLLSASSGPTQRARFCYFFGCGLLIGIRPTASIFSLVFGALWFLVVEKKRGAYPPPLGVCLASLFIFIGIAPAIIWNYLLWGSVLGGYGAVLHKVVDADGGAFLPRLWQILFSPYRGFFFYNPLTLLAFGAVTTIRSFDPKKKAIFISIGLSCLLHLVLCATNPTWHGGLSFGPRYMLDILAPLFLCVGIGLEAVIRSRFFPVLSRGIVLIFAVYSVAIHLLGAKGGTSPWYEVQALDYRIRAWFTTQ